jgi:AraC-like DNA-binding protein
MDREDLKKRLSYFMATSIYAYGSSEWMSGNFSLQFSDETDWPSALDILISPIPIKFSTHFTHEPVSRHTHRYYEIMYMFSGSLIHYFDDEEIALHEGDCLMVAPGVYHSIGSCGAEDIGINIIIDKSYLTPDFLVLLPSCTPIIDFFSDKGDKLYLPGRGNLESAKIAELLVSEFLNPDIASACMIKCYLATLLTSLFRVYGENQGRVYTTDDTGRGDLSFILSYIENNCSTTTLAETASRFGYDKYYLSKLIVQKLGKSFTEIKHFFCIEQAKYLLTSTQLPVRTISEMVGYSNISYFYSIFTKHIGKSPTEYRNCYSIKKPSLR